MLTKRQSEILQLLNDSNQSISLSELTDLFKKGVRAIRYDISDIRKTLSIHGGEIKTTSDGKYFIPYNKRIITSEILAKNMSNQINLVAQDRDSQFLMLLIVFCINDYCSLVRLQNQFYLSQTALLKLISDFNEAHVDKFEIKHRSKEGYYLCCDEYTFRITLAKNISQLLMKHNSPERWYLKMPTLIADVIGLHELTELSGTIKKANSLFQVWVKNEIFSLLISYFIVSYCRLKLGLTRSVDSSTTMEISENVKEYIDYVFDHQSFFEYDEIELILAAKAFNEFNIFIQEGIEIDHKLDRALGLMIEYLKNEVTKYKYNYVSLYDDLSIHLQNYITHRNHHEISNSLLHEQIAIKYADIYQIAKKCAQFYEVVFNEELPSVEIEYITIYLFKNSEQTLLTKNVIVVSSADRGLSNLLATRIRRVFPQLNIVAKTSLYHSEILSSKEEIDFIISTMPIEEAHYPVLRISSLLGPEDILKINKYLSDPGTGDVNYYESYEFSNPYSLASIALLDQSNVLSKYANTMSYIILTLIDYGSSFSEEYALDSDTLFGLVIHLVISIPRWFDTQAENDEVSNEYLMLFKTHADLIRKLEEFFLLVEETLLISISNTEKYAFAQYIIRRN